MNSNWFLLSGGDGKGSTLVSGYSSSKRCIIRSRVESRNCKRPIVKVLGNEHADWKDCALTVVQLVASLVFSHQGRS